MGVAVGVNRGNKRGDTHVEVDGEETLVLQQFGWADGANIWAC